MKMRVIHKIKKLIKQYFCLHYSRVLEEEADNEKHIIYSKRYCVDCGKSVRPLPMEIMSDELRHQDIFRKWALVRLVNYKKYMSLMMRSGKIK